MRKTLIMLTAMTAIIGAGFAGHANAASLAPQADPLVQTVQYYGESAQYYGGDWRREREERHRYWERRHDWERERHEHRRW